MEKTCELCEVLIAAQSECARQQLNQAMWLDRAFRFDGDSHAAIEKLAEIKAESDKCWQNLLEHIKSHAS